jgi:hypothetical protein
MFALTPIEPTGKLLYIYKDWFIALRCTIVYTNYHKSVPDTSLHETSDVM